jgi:uncharacterized protein (TIGR02246 family)
MDRNAFRMRGGQVGMSESPEAIAHALVRAINRHDVDAVAQWMADDHQFTDSLGATVVGRETMRAGWAGYFRMVPDYTIAVEETYCDGPVVVLLGIAQGTYTTDGQLKPENSWSTPAAFRAFIEDGRIAEWRVYADNDPIRQLMKKAS